MKCLVNSYGMVICATTLGVAQRWPKPANLVDLLGVKDRVARVVDVVLKYEDGIRVIPKVLFDGGPLLVPQDLVLFF